MARLLAGIFLLTLRIGTGKISQSKGENKIKGGEDGDNNEDQIALRASDDYYSSAFIL